MNTGVQELPSSAHSKFPHVDGWPINLFDLQTAVRQIIAAAQLEKPFTVFTINLDHLVKLGQNEAFRDAYRAADFVSADGAPLAWLARRQNPAVERTTGADLLLPLIEAAASEKLPIFLFGTSPDALAQTRTRLTDSIGGSLQIAGALSPSASFDPRGPEADMAIDSIRRSGAKLCFVALGAPKQEIFAEYARRAGLNCGMICIGAAIDFVAGSQIRSPMFFRQTGTEWVWRLASNPRRLAKRYLDCAVIFAKIALRSERLPIVTDLEK